ncbi:MAG: hypothetical protein ACI93T_001414, partial [Porticoccaceae bacterium]
MPLALPVLFPIRYTPALSHWQSQWHTLICISKAALNN